MRSSHNAFDVRNGSRQRLCALAWTGAAARPHPPADLLATVRPSTLGCCSCPTAARLRRRRRCGRRPHGPRVPHALSVSASRDGGISTCTESACIGALRRALDHGIHRAGHCGAATAAPLTQCKPQATPRPSFGTLMPTEVPCAAVRVFISVHLNTESLELVAATLGPVSRAILSRPPHHSVAPALQDVPPL